MGWKSEKIMELLDRVEALEIAAGIKAPPESLAPAAPRVTRRVGDISQDGPPVPIPEPAEPRPEELRRWEIWTEGYVTTGERGPAAYHGQYIGVTWDCAVSAWATENGLKVDFTPGVGYTFWGCRLYDNGEAARASFG